ncbi:MAG: DUF2284 domain-containing protein [Clostridia bacterium]|nr:DUF2284 domain-containing protein [Clostridia bacterium]
MDTKKWMAAALEAGACNAAMIAVKDMVFDTAFRDMCAANACGVYGKCHMCPPDVGDINDLIAEAKSYRNALVFQYIGRLEDSFDIEGMKESKDKLRTITFALRDRLIADGEADCLLLGAGGCGVCERCSKLDDQPCKAPHLAIPSLEAYGVNVSKLAAAAGMKYINGVNTVTYFGAILMK